MIGTRRQFNHKRCDCYPVFFFFFFFYPRIVVIVICVRSFSETTQGSQHCLISLEDFNNTVSPLVIIIIITIRPVSVFFFFFYFIPLPSYCVCSSFGCRLFYCFFFFFYHFPVYHCFAVVVIEADYFLISTFIDRYIIIDCYYLHGYCGSPVGNIDTNRFKK